MVWSFGTADSPRLPNFSGSGLVLSQEAQFAVGHRVVRRCARRFRGSPLEEFPGARSDLRIGRDWKNIANCVIICGTGESQDWVGERLRRSPRSRVSSSNPSSCGHQAPNRAQPILSFPIASGPVGHLGIESEDYWQHFDLAARESKD